MSFSEDVRDRAITCLLKRCRPVFDYYERLSRWDGGCALPEEPSKGERLDFTEAVAKLAQIERDRRRHCHVCNNTPCNCPDEP